MTDTSPQETTTTESEDQAINPRLGLGLVILVFILDQVSKWVMLGPLDLRDVRNIDVFPGFSLTMVWNKGISMGLPMGEWLGKNGIIILTIAICLYLAHWLRGARDRIEIYALALILGGAIGNLVDRFIHGAVVDFIHLHAWGYNFYVFNVADAAITIGAVLLVGESLRTALKRPKKDTRTD